MIQDTRYVMSGLPIIFSDIVVTSVIVSCPSILLPVAWWIRFRSYMITREWQGCRVQDRRYKIHDTRCPKKQTGRPRKTRLPGIECCFSSTTILAPTGSQPSSWPAPTSTRLGEWGTFSQWPITGWPSSTAPVMSASQELHGNA